MRDQGLNFRTFVVLAAVFAVTIAQAQPGYILTLPRVLRARSEESFCITLHEVDEPVFSFTLRLTHTETDKEHDFEYEISESFSKCMTLTVPTETGKYKVTLRNDTAEIPASSSTDVEVKPQNLITLVQTDKPIYKPGQKVRFRVMTLNRYLQTKTGLIQSIFIKNPNKIRVKQWLSIPTEGLTSYNFPMPAEPTLGEWEIDVTFEGETTTQTFKVEEYVLPRFDVKITPPPFLVCNASTIDGKVCAEYTYGKPVEGYVSLEVCLKGSYESGRPCYYETKDINGCYQFSINSSEVEMSNMNYYLYGSKLQIRATVTEKNTGAVVNKTTEEPTVTYDAVQIALEDDTNGFFKPVFPYHGRARVTTPDGKPAPNELIKVAFVDFNNDIRLEDNYTTDSNGMIYFSVCDNITEDTKEFSIEAEGVLYSDSYDYYGMSNNPYKPKTSRTIKHWFSPSRSYIAIPRQKRTVQCREELEVTVPYSTTLNSFTKFYYQVMSRGRILHTGHKLHHFLKHDSYKFLEVPMSTCLQSVPTASPPAESESPQEAPYQTEFVGEPLMVRKKRASVEPMMEGEQAAEEAPSPPPLPKQSRHVSHFKIRVPVTEEMSPSASLLVYYVRDDGEVVADSIDFDVEPCFKNKVKLDFLEKKVVPGGEATLRLEAEPDSLCSVGVVDKSINVIGGDHQITPKKMFDLLKEFDVDEARHHFYFNNREYCEKQDLADDDEIYGGWMYYSSKHADSIQAFRQIGMAVSTNLDLETRPCFKDNMRYDDSDLSDGIVWSLPGPAVLPLDLITPKREKKKPGSALRSFFPETWLWELEKVSETGIVELRKVAPHTVTKWVGNSICTSPTAGMGVSPMTSLTTFQPFFLSMNLPYAAVRGERLPIHITVYNYLTKCLHMQVQLRPSDEVTFVIRDHLKLPFCLCGGKTKTLSYFLEPKEIGRLPVVAEAEIVPGMCDNDVEPDTEYVGLSDAVKRTLFIKVEGVTQEYTKSIYICPKEDEVLQETIDLPLPNDIVSDSARGHIAVIGDIMGPALNNLDSLVNLPTGCGEQTMISFAPNIYVLKYLTFTLQLTDSMKSITERYMEVGYNRELNYVHDDGSFSAFGKQDTSGSTWLTAFVVKSFAQAQRFIYIDQTVIDKAVKFLKTTSMENGCFREVGKVISSYMMGGLGKLDGEDDTALTAFVVVALLEARTPSSDRVLRSALRCLSLQPVDEMDTYTLALLAYALALNDSSSDHTGRVMEQLNNRVISDGALSYWGRDGSKPEAVNTWHYQTAPSAEIEMTSYALMATLLYYKEDVIPKSKPIVMWLSQQRNSFGGFSSTQDTVLGLQALSEFASRTYNGNVTDLSVNFDGEMTSAAYDVITGINTLLLQKSQIKQFPNKIKVSANGTGCALVQANVQYNKLPDNLGIDKPMFNLSIAVRRSLTRRSDCARRSMRLCLNFRAKKDVSAGMSLLTVKMVTAWTPVLETLKKLEASFPILSMKKYENDVEKGLIAFYFDELDGRRRCFEIEVEQDRELAVTDPKEAEIQAFQYYERDATIVTSYNIKTTCGTKAEEKNRLPAWPAGVPMPWRRTAMPPIPTQKPPDVGCPRCLTEVPDNFNEIICRSKAIYKAVGGRNGKAPMKIKANLRPRKKTKIDEFASFSLGKKCQCDLLNPPNKKRVKRLLILSRSERSFVKKEQTDNQEVDHVIYLDRATVIVNMDRKLEKETKRKAKKCGRKLL